MGGMFSKPKAPDVQTPAPAIQDPVQEVKSPEMGAQESSSEKKNKGKKALKIDLNSKSGGSGVGLNTPR